MYTQQLVELETFLGHIVNILPTIDPHWLPATDDHSTTYNFETILTDKHYKCESSPSSLFEQLLAKPDIRFACDTLMEYLSESVQERVMATPSHCKLCIKIRDSSEPGTCHHSKVGILFSGGIDCTILALLADRYIHPDDDIDLINVSFEKVKRIAAQPVCASAEEIYCTPDRQSARESLKELHNLCPRR